MFLQTCIVVDVTSNQIQSQFILSGGELNNIKVDLKYERIFYTNDDHNAPKIRVIYYHNLLDFAF